MRRAAAFASAFLVATAATAAIAAGVFGETTHVYPVQLTISVDRSEHKITGTVSSKAPSEFCEESAVRLMKVESGKDRKVSSVRPGMFGKWGIKTTSKLSGSKVYAEVLKYHLPDRPVICLAARSRSVTAP